MRAVASRPEVRAAILGLGSALLPCGWLYAFVVTAAGTGRPCAAPS
jgi:sulfite exporter TauE/SafE